MESKIIHTEKGLVEVSRIGSGIPILFVHGGHFNSEITLFHKGFDLNQFCLITPSRPGYGATPLTKENKTAQGTADLMISLLSELSIQKVVLIGISAGGLAAIEIAAKYPERVEKLILISAITSNWVIPNKSIYKFARFIFDPNIERFMWWLFRSMYALMPRLMAKIMFKELSDYRPIDITEGEILELKKMVDKLRSKEGFTNDIHQKINEEDLTKITCKTLILHSNFDHTVGLEHPENANAKIPNSKLITFNNRWGHILWLGNERKQPLADILSFLNTP